MALIVNNDTFVSVSELNDVLKYCMRFKGPECEISFSTPAERIDIAFIGGLFLLHKDEGRTFYLYGPEENPTGVFLTDSHHTAEVMQYIAQLQMLYGVEDKVDDWIWIQNGRSSTGELTFFNPTLLTENDNNLLWTTKFAPILFVNQENLIRFFYSKEKVTPDSLVFRYGSGLNDESNDLEKAYFLEITDNHLLNVLYDNPPVYTYIYSIIHTIVKPFKNCESIEVAQSRIESLMAFCKRYVAGILELAKNIVEHSKNRQGIITIGSYAKDDDSGRDIEAYVFDYGDCGIVPTMIAELEKSGGKTRQDKEDKEILESTSDTYELKDFFKPGQSKRLFRQIRREMAHFGLIHFVSLITSNRGKCLISSENKEHKKESYAIDDCEDKSLYRGTSYYFSLPMAKGMEPKGNYDEFSRKPVTRESIAAMPRIWEIENSIKTIVLKSQKVITRSDEQSLLQQVSFDGDYSYYAIDFANIEDMSSNSLLRILVMISETTDKGIIVFNVETSVFSEMMNSNAKYFSMLRDSQLDISFWIKGKALLVYSKYETIEKRKLYFADMLYGDNQSAFMGVNKIISNTFPNYVTIASTEKTAVTDSYIDNVAGPYFKQSTLLPFDLVIKNRDKEPLFFTNLRTLINKPLSK